MNTNTTANTSSDLRDQFAMAALSGLLASEGEGVTPSHEAADRAYAIADEMLIARDRPRQEKQFRVYGCDFICMETGSDKISRWNVRVTDGGRGFDLEVRANADKDELTYDAPYALLFNEEDDLYVLVAEKIAEAMDRPDAGDFE